jgi:hypothetical protein
MPCARLSSILVVLLACSESRLPEPAMRVAASDAGMAAEAGLVDDAPVGDELMDAGGDTDAAPAGRDAAPPRELCDGSTDIRLVSTLYGGAVDLTYAFTNPYGHQFFVVDGQCQFYVSFSFNLGVFGGVLDRAQAEQLATEIGFGKLDQWSGKYGMGCPDSSPYLLASATGDVSCNCGCEGLPPGAGEALSSASEWMQRLQDLGEPLDRAVRAVATMGYETGRPPAVDWPLARALADISGLLFERNTVPEESALFDARQDVGPLLELRRKVWMGRTDRAPYALVQDGTGFYELYMRDELPSKYETALPKFITAAQKRNYRRDRMP